jgi:hypothetical protein
MLLLARRAMMPLGRRVALPKLGVPVRPVPLLVRGVVDRALTTGPSSAVQLPRPGDTAWESLNESQQSAAVVLGWSPETWASGMHVPPLSSGLSGEQKLAVCELGYASAADWDQVPRGWIDPELEEEADNPRSGADWSGIVDSAQGDPGSASASGSSGAASGLRGVALRLLVAILTGAALCIGAETAGLLPDAPEPPKPADSVLDR